MSKEQEYWDACLIRTWRNFGTLNDAIFLYRSILNEWPNGLLRMPHDGFPRKIGVRFFVASYLEKISARLLEQEISKDILLLRKLKTSKYDTSSKPAKQCSGLSSEKSALKKNNQKNMLERRNYSIRNKKTDWATVK